MIKITKNAGMLLLATFLIISLPIVFGSGLYQLQLLLSDLLAIAAAVFILIGK